ncbi:FAD-dependent oxidoreductase [Nocardiopsis ansamitocini]|uniref:ferredoxin--NADP(+) reductase n=1 Tax=Nocardiopsis ansamitocini TaxID=1670832 RepID=A0A9W6P8I0_9ACTN|nr:FAD-dependent oxidoreductase [Nocardiopsis ansamitocini]GLU48987.1 NADP oxidoreductase [Nocardiopsis ansamitocini]
MEPSDALRVAVIGSGPAGIYTAQALIGQTREPVAVDVIDRLPTPYGLVRYGVAPDHPTIKTIAAVLARVLEDPRVQFVGGVEFGRDVTRTDLAHAYHAVVYATGASTDRLMGIPGEELPGSIAAVDIVNWYSGHPDTGLGCFALDSEEVAVVGAGNVALDVVRVLSRTVDDLRRTDVPAPVLDALAASRIHRVHLVARRGPDRTRFSPKELRELGRLPGVGIGVHPTDPPLSPSLAPEEMSRTARTNVRTLAEWARHPKEGVRRVELRFWRRPTAVLGTRRVEGLELEHTRLDDEGRLQGTGEREVLPVGMVVRSVGSVGRPLPGVPFDPVTATVPHDRGRALDSHGHPMHGEYVAGWLKRGAYGVIGTNKSDAAETARALLEDAPMLRRTPPDVCADRMLADCGAATSSYTDWLDIDAAEAALARRLSRGERVKLCGWPELLRAIGDRRHPGR